MNKDKKIISIVNYKKGTESNNHIEIKSLIEKATNIFIKNQKIYQDKTQSITIEVHFIPEEKVSV